MQPRSHKNPFLLIFHECGRSIFRGEFPWTRLIFIVMLPNNIAWAEGKMKHLICIQMSGFHLICYSHKQIGLRRECRSSSVLQRNTGLHSALRGELRNTCTTLRTIPKYLHYPLSYQGGNGFVDELPALWSCLATRRRFAGHCPANWLTCNYNRIIYFKCE